jgi:hypothetical protein
MAVEVMAGDTTLRAITAAGARQASLKAKATPSAANDTWMVNRNNHSAGKWLA